MVNASEVWDEAVTWEEYLAGVVAHADLWRHHAESAALDDTSRDRLADLPGPRRVLILTEDWCGDAVRSVPTLVAACEAAPDLAVRLIDIAHHEELMKGYLSKGGKAIPVAIVLDGEGRELGWWGPRPAALQTMMRERLRELGPPDRKSMGSFYAPIMGWYRKDGGRTVLDEFLLLLERDG